ncbi:protein-disulfide reductase DsbD family protein [Parvularcula oceani]|uniref:protein-disulfide reductase DsbD family protein n=1 Tax=Parvularcula oceani TaxID=1247963 RepID=UPI0004E25E25|nr:protein-disulfide reductase DsbD domain-containing protein [Parvularcula oceani]
MIRFLVSLAALFALFAPAAAQTGPVVETDHAASRLIAEREGAVPGETAWIALRQELEEHWHVYWRNPGDSGLPLEIDWTLPEGFEAGEVIYPLPHRLPLGPLVNYGHEGEPVFLVPLSVPETAQAGETARIVAEANWLICADVCVPEQARLTLDLPIMAEEAPPAAFAQEIGEALAARPRPAPFDAAYAAAEAGPVLRLAADLDAPEFYPFEPALIEPAGRQDVSHDEGATLIAFDGGFDYLDAPPETLEGLVVTGSGANRQGYIVEAMRAEEGAAFASAPAPAPLTAGGGAGPAPAALGATLLFAFLGGLILNVMPCVFPVVFMKAASLAGSAGHERAVVRRHGVLYTAGVLATFLAIAGVLIALRAGGEQLGWGFQLQNPVVVGLFAVIILLVGLNLAGLFEVGTSVQGLGQGLTQRGGNAGAFFTGMLAVAVAAPCIGPFLGVPVGYALAQPAMIGLLVFAVVGLGLAAPYLLLSIVPVLGRLLPKPGPWMVTFKQLLSFAMFGTLVWLAWVLSLQAGPQGVLLLGVALVLAAFAAWAFGRSQGGSRGWRVAALAGLVLALLPLARVETVVPQAIAAETDDRSKLPTVPYGEERLAELRAEGVPVFVDFTAAWCVTCQVNKQTVLNRREVIDAFHERGVRYMVADWTVQDPEITRALEAQGRSGVPLYLYYAPGAEAARVLPQVLSVDGVIGLFDDLEKTA